MADTKRIVAIVGAGCGVLLLAACCFAAAGFYYCKSEWEGADGAVESFLADVRQGRIESAYGRMSQSYRDRYDLAAFREMLEDTPPLREQKGEIINQRHFEPGRTKLGGRLTTTAGPVPFQAILDKEEGGWKIARIEVGEEARPPPRPESEAEPPPPGPSLEP